MGGPVVTPEEECEHLLGTPVPFDEAAAAAEAGEGRHEKRGGPAALARRSAVPG